MSKLPKTAVPHILGIVLTDWASTYRRYQKDLDRINGQVQWTDEAIDHLNSIHDGLLGRLQAYLDEVDLTTTHSF
jgi:hypothetical protein